MYIVLLSGGSGKRLWPLSNDLCSKQYIKLMNPDEAEHSESTEKCSMLQRVFGQLKAASLSENTIVCASDSQVELIESQLDGQAEVAVEPMRRNTFPAVMLSCAYLLSNKGAKPDFLFAVFCFLVNPTNFYSGNISQFLFIHLHPIWMQSYTFSSRIQHDYLSQVFLMG